MKITFVCLRMNDQINNNKKKVEKISYFSYRAKYARTSDTKF